MKIKEHIKELLVVNQGVIIPGFGGFVSEYEPAAFDVNENNFIPPSKKISFNPKYSYHDTLLIDFISKKENVDKEISKKNLDDFVKELKAQLEKGEKVDFPEIGSLSKNTKGEIVFKQDTKSNFLTDSFGLSSVKTKPIVKQQAKTIQTHQPAKLKRSFKKLIIIGSSAIVFLTLVVLSWFLTNGYSDFSLFSSNEINTDLIVDTKSETAENNLDSIAKADSVKALINQSIDENTDKKDALFYSEPEEDPKPKYSEFHIIAGSFKKIENAEIFASKLKDKGFEPKIIHSGEKLIRIAIFSYTDEGEALTKLYLLRETTDIKSVWILKSI